MHDRHGLGYDEQLYAAYENVHTDEKQQVGHNREYRLVRADHQRHQSRHYDYGADGGL
jgi:hypothetical protein